MSDPDVIGYRVVVADGELLAAIDQTRRGTQESDGVLASGDGHTTPLVIPASTDGSIDEWDESTAYAVGDQVTYAGWVYTCKTAHTSGTTFDSTKWRVASGLSGVTARDAYTMDLVVTRVVNANVADNRYMEVVGTSPGCNIDGEFERVYGVGSARNLYISTDNGATWGSAVYSFSSPYTIDLALELSNGDVLLKVTPDSGSAQGEIWRSTDSGATFTLVFTFQADPVGSTLLHSRSWCEHPTTAGTVFMGEYGEGRGTGTNPGDYADMRLLKSTDYGATWSAVHTFTDIRHVHLVQFDPYEPGRMFVGTGDLNTESDLYLSDDDGATLTNICNGAASEGNYNKARQTALGFLEDAIVWGSDNALVAGKNPMYRLPRENLLLANGSLDTTPTIELVAYGQQNATRALIVVPDMGVCAFTQAVSPRDWVDFICTADGRNWQVVERWPRRRDSDSFDSIPAYFSEADDNGGFWISDRNLEDTEDVATGRLSLYVTMRRRRLVDRPYPSLHERYERSQVPEYTEYRAGFVGDVDSTAGTNTDVTINPAMPADFEIVDAYLIHDGSDFAANADNYFTVTVRRRTSAAAVSGGLATWGGTNTALAGKTPIQRTATTANRGLAGEAVILRFTKTGTPASALTNPTAVIRVKLINQEDMR